MPLLSRILSSLVCASSLCAAGCSVYAGGGGGGGGDDDRPPVPTGPPSAVEQQLQALLQATYPGGTIVAGPGTDDSVMLDSPQGDPLQRAVVPVGAPLSVAINYTSQQPVTAMCVGFGSPNNAYCVPVGTPGVITTGSSTAGALALALPVPAELCAMLSSICHDIRCYEFAQTSGGTFSQANINLLAAACGGCDEPSCQDLLDMCVDAGDDPCAGSEKPVCTGDTPYCCQIEDAGTCAFEPHCDPDPCSTYGEQICQ
jgi:hypothetical protein